MVMLDDTNGLLSVISAPKPRVEARDTRRGPVFNSGAPRKDGYKPPDAFRSFKDLKRIGLDIETNDPDLDKKGPGPHRENGRVVGVGIAYSKTDATYYPTEHDDRSRNVENPDAYYRWLKEEAKAFDGEIVGANLFYDFDWLRVRHDITFPNAKIRDVQTAAPLIDENRMTYSLNSLLRDYLGESKHTDSLSEIYGSGFIDNMHKVDPGWAGMYCERDCTAPWDLFDKQYKILEQQGLTELFDIEARLTPLLLQMRDGVRVDLDAAQNAKDIASEEVKKAHKEIKDICGISIDLWAANSIAQAFDRMGLEYTKTKTGKPSFKKGVLEKHPSELAKAIVRARDYDRTMGTFIDSYVFNSNIKGRLHCMFNQLRSDDSGTVSGRFSSSHPNLQNIPTRHPVLGPLCRQIFVPEEGEDWGCVDWSQIEYRFLVHYADMMPGINASAAVDAYSNDKNTDFHDMAAEFTGLPRKHAKNVNFGVVYGMGVRSLAAILGVSEEEAEIILEKFHAKSPFLRDMLDAARRRANKAGYIRTILGRRRRFDLWECHGKWFQSKELATEFFKEKNNELQAKGLASRIYPPQRARTHSALNALLQGSAADLMKKAMVAALEAGLFAAIKPLLTVHDELDVSIPRTKEAKEAFKELTHIMETIMPLRVPVLASANTGKNWQDAK